MLACPLHSMCIQPVNDGNTGVQHEAAATVVPPFIAEMGMSERESHNPRRTEAGFQPNSSSIPPSNNMRSHPPLTLREDKKKEWNKNSKDSHRGNGPAKTPKRK